MSTLWQWLRTLWSRSRATITSRRLDREFDEELSTHLELIVDECRAQGMSPADARREAVRRLGQPTLLREVHRQQRGVLVIEPIVQDVRYAVRMLAKSPVFTSVAALSLALGIGANTALFSLVDDLLLRSLAVRDPDRLVEVHQFVEALGFRKSRLLLPQEAFDAVGARSQVVSELIGFDRFDRPAVTIDGVLEPSREVEHVSGNFFRDLGVPLALGRAPEPSEETVAIIGAGMWRDRFDGSAGVLGRSLSVNGETFTIVGVASPRFLGISIETATDIWVSSSAGAKRMIARLKPGVTLPQARAELDLVLTQALPQSPDEAKLRTEVLPAGKGLSQLRAQYAQPLLALTVLVTVLLLLTCANVGSLMMVRNTARRRELMVRVALGARRSRLVIQYLVESLVLASLGGVLAIAFARWGVSVLLATLPLSVTPPSLAFALDARVVGFAAAVSLISGLLFGLVPAWRATQVDLTGALRQNQDSTPTRRARRLGRVLVACQVGLSMLLLVGAGLFLQTLRNLSLVDVGFDPNNLLQVSMDTRGAGYRDGQVGPLYRLLLERVATISGVKSVTGIRNPVMRHSLSRMRATMPGLVLGRNDFWDSAEVAPKFFETMGIPLIRGRLFTDSDFARGGGVFVVNEAWVKRFFPNGDPVDRGNGIVGVVGNVRIAGVRGDGAPMMYEVSRLEPDRVSALEVRTVGDPGPIAAAIRTEIQRVHPRLFVDIRTMRQEIDRDIARERMVATTSGFFSALGLLLASIGIFGVASYTVAQRTTELGIRMALGASRWTVIRESLRDTMWVFCAGLTGGLIAAILAVRVTASIIADLLFGLTATDVLNIGAAVFLMIVVALAACILPARRATRIDPISAIRCE
jgi:predicted permease